MQGEVRSEDLRWKMVSISPPWRITTGADTSLTANRASSLGRFLLPGSLWQQGVNLSYSHFSAVPTQHQAMGTWVLGGTSASCLQELVTLTQKKAPECFIAE